MIKSSKIISRFWIPIISTIRHYPYSKPFHKYLRNLPQVQCSCLNNGLVIASEERECYEACVGIFIKAGSRYESLFENGMTHFFEHIAFKGTKSQSKTVLEKKISKMGARFHCFTTREVAVYYADCLSEDLPAVFELLAESVFNNCFSRHDITEQKRVVYSEMVDHDNNPNEVLFDYLHSTAFQGTPLARTVIGPSSNLYNFNECTISRYVQRLFDPSRIVLAAVGCFKHEQLRCLAETYLNILEPKKCVDTGEYRFTGSEVRFRDDSMPVRRSDVQGVCNRYIYDRCPAVAAVGQTEGLPEYTRIRAGMYWLRL